MSKTWIKKNFPTLKSDLSVYKLIVFVGLTDFTEAVGESHRLCKVVLC